MTTDPESRFETRPAERGGRGDACERVGCESPIDRDAGDNLMRAPFVMAA